MENIGNKIGRRIKDFTYSVSYFLHRLLLKLRIVKSGGGVKKMRRNKNLFILCMLAIPILHFLIFWFYVNLDLLLIAFQRFENEEIVYTLENFRLVFEDLAKDRGGLNIALKNTLITWVFTTLFMFPLSILWSYFIYKKLLLGSFYRIVFYIPSIISAVALAAVFKYIITADGPVGKLYELMYPDKMMPVFLKESEYAMKTVLFYVFWTGFGGNLILLNGAMGRIPKEIIESAYMDGVCMWREVWYFVLPLCWPTLSTLIIFSFAGIFTASGPILLLTNGSADTDTISFWIYKEVNYSEFNIYVPAALGWVFTLIGLPIILIIRKLMNKLFADVEF